LVHIYAFASALCQDRCLSVSFEVKLEDGKTNIDSNDIGHGEERRYTSSDFGQELDPFRSFSCKR
jgi:hypothetical protein